MDIAEQILLKAIQKSLWNTNIEFPEDTDWDAALEEAEKQAVLGVIANAIPTEVRQKNKGRFAAITAKYVRTLFAQTQVVQLMEKHQIPMVILKGAAAAIYYPVPSQRSMGDIDFFVLDEQYEKANHTLEENGYRYLSEHQDKRHKSYSKDQMEFEIHRFFSYPDLYIESYIIEGLKHPETRIIDGNPFPTLPKLANGLVLLSHLIHHFKNGIGLRQLIDWMTYVDKVLDDSFWEKEFKAAAEKTGLLTAALVATRSCQLYLGLPLEKASWCIETDSVICQQFIDSLLTSGNFGRKQGEGNIIGNITSSFCENGLFVSLKRLQQIGERNWKAYHRHKWLKPFAWFYQICRYIRKGLRSKQRKSEMMEEIGNTRKRRELYRTIMLSPNVCASMSNQPTYPDVEQLH